MLRTEMRNEATRHIDKMDTLSMLKLINDENIKAAKAVEAATDSIAKVCDAVAERYEKGGRIFYIGAGTSGRLGVADAAECPPTCGIPKDRVIGIIAGGERCMAVAAEAEEDDPKAGAEELKKYNLSPLDTVVGISASGGAAYVVGALEYANRVGALSVSLSSNYGTPMEEVAQTAIVTDTGPEVITGSTRMKSGTAQKLVLNMISTSVMVKMGYVYENLMINLKPGNIKLKNRMVSIVCDIMKCDVKKANELLDKYSWNIRAVAEGEGK